MNNALSAQPECGLSENPPAGAAALAAFLSAPAQALPPIQLKPAFLLPGHSREVRLVWRQVLNNVAEFLACSHEDKVFLFAQIDRRPRLLIGDAGDCKGLPTSPG
ncbi:hypothetical protein [Iodobacter ciconiae]|uniref:Uncharacterized protein n=1 Tax=Iodobacter ciconiae TaxID=2496266 RepID=A0A3S8ZPK5_9NEIS|nr:hypothetical protein [Iodobacter ciconiae]AZN35396.1 hypothetical protein EJO50_02180 [Iodobacter ciconiae]